MAWRWPKVLGWSWPIALSGRRVAPHRPVAADLWASAPGASETPASPISALLSDIEAAACAVYARHGLPDRQGQYARSPKAEGWRFLSQDLTAEERWAFVTAQRPGSGWRFGALEDLGEQAAMPDEVRRAAGVLRACARVRNRLAEGGSASLGEELEAAIQLGAQWRQMQAPAVHYPAATEPLRLTVPTRPRAKRKSRAKSRTTADNP